MGLPTLIMKTRPSDKGSIKSKPTKFKAMVCPAKAVAPKKEIIKAAPLNMLSSTKTPKLIGTQSLVTLLNYLLGLINLP